MAATNLERPTAPTDKTVLGMYYALASTEDLEKAVKVIEFELTQRQTRDEVAIAAKQLSETRRDEVRTFLDSLNDAAAV